MSLAQKVFDLVYQNREKCGIKFFFKDEKDKGHAYITDLNGEEFELFVELSCKDRVVMEPPCKGSIPIEDIKRVVEAVKGKGK
jgi:hypothetical protein